MLKHKNFAKSFVQNTPFYKLIASPLPFHFLIERSHRPLHRSCAIICITSVKGYFFYAESVYANVSILIRYDS